VILTFAFPCASAWGQDPPANLAKLVAHRESESEAERNEYMYRQTVTIDELDDRCWVLQVRPRQILDGQRFFDGMIWVDKKEYNIVRMEGQAVPQIRTTKTENLFPRFTTLRKPVDGKHWFPIYTYADDTLHFRNGPQRERLRISYGNYKRFGAETTFTPK
jgi:hypothetical protein